MANDGTLTGTGVVLDGTLPTGSTAASVTTPSGSCPVTGSTFRCTIGSVAPGASVPVTIRVTAPATPGVVTTSIQVVSSGGDTVTANDSASLTTTVRVPAPPGTVVLDEFERTAPSGGGLGTTDTGQPWTVHRGAFTIDAGQAAPTAGSTSVASVDPGFLFGTYEVTITEGGAEQFWIAVRVLDGANYYRLGRDPWNANYRLSKVVNGVEQPLFANFTRVAWAPQDGDVVRIVLRPDDGIYVYVNGQHIIDAGDQQFVDVAGFGFVTANTAPRFDGVSISPVLQAFPISDTFSRADSSTLGTPEVGSAWPWRSWVGGPWAVTGGRARHTWTTYGMTAIDASTEAAGVQARFSVIGSQQWVVFRHAEDGSYYRFGAPSGGTYRVQFIRNGAVTATVPVTRLVSRVVTAGDVVQVVQRLDGNVELRVNGVVTHRFKDTVNNVRATSYGMAANGTVARLDDFAVTLPPG